MDVITINYRRNNTIQLPRNFSNTRDNDEWENDTYEIPNMEYELSLRKKVMDKMWLHRKEISYTIIAIIMSIMIILIVPDISTVIEALLKSLITRHTLIGTNSKLKTIMNFLNLTGIDVKYIKQGMVILGDGITREKIMWTLVKIIIVAFGRFIYQKTKTTK